MGAVLVEAQRMTNSDSEAREQEEDEVSRSSSERKAVFE